MFMVRKVYLLLGLALLISVSARAQDKVEVFGGYSYQRVDSSPSFNQNGWEIAGQYKLADFLGVVGDFDGHYGSVEAPRHFHSHLPLRAAGFLSFSRFAVRSIPGRWRSCGLGRGER